LRKKKLEEGKFMGEKTFEQLTQELEELKKQNLLLELEQQQEIAKKQKEEQANKEKEKLKEELREQIKKEYNLTATSRLQTTGTGQQSMNLAGDKTFEEFKAGYISRAQKRGLDIKGRTYAEILEDMSYRRVA